MKNRFVKLVFVVFAVILAGLMAGSRESAATQNGPTVHAPAPGGFKSDLHTRYTWTVKPIHIIGNIYYVGLSRNESWLITTPEGHFLLDESVPEEVGKNIEDLGFHTKDVKYLMFGHAHMSHVFGIAQLKEMTGAKVLAMQGDVAALADGGESEDFLPNMTGPVFLPVKPDRIIHDGEKIELGGVTMVAHLTAGHTPGCTTWTTVAEENGMKYNVVLYGACNSMNQPLVDNKKNPEIAKEFENQYKILRSLHGDVLLGTGGGALHALIPKAEMRDKNPGTNPFIDPKGYEDFVAKNQKTFEDQLAKEKSGGSGYPIKIESDGPCPKDARGCYCYYKLIMDCCAKIGAKPVPYDR